MKLSKRIFILSILFFISALLGCTDPDYKAYKQTVNDYSRTDLPSSKGLLADTTKKLHGLKFPNVNFDDKHLYIHDVNKPIILINDRNKYFTDFYLLALNTVYNSLFENKVHIIVNSAFTKDCIEDAENAYFQGHKVIKGYSANDHFKILYTDEFNYETIDDFNNSQINGLDVPESPLTIFYIGKNNRVYKIYDFDELSLELSLSYSKAGVKIGALDQNMGAQEFLSHLREIIIRDIKELLEYE